MTANTELIERLSYLASYYKGQDIYKKSKDAIEVLEAERDVLVNSANALDVEATRLAKQITETKGVAVKLMAERDALQAEAERLRVIARESSEYATKHQTEVLRVQAQLAAAQGQEPTGYLLPITGKFVHGGKVMAGHAGANWVKLYAAPIPQQVAQQAQPEPVNAMLVEALEQVIKEPWVSGVRRIAKAALTAAQQVQPKKTLETMAQEAALEQAQPEPVAVVDEVGVIVVCSYKYKPGDKLYVLPQQAQPEPVEGSLSKLLHQVIYGDYCGDNPDDLNLALAARVEYQTIKQAQPESECGNTPYDEGPFTIAQPERAPLIPCRCFDEVSKRLCIDKNKCVRIEAQGIKQGGQHD